MDNLNKTLNIQFSYLPVINFAMQQNRIAVIRELTIENLTEDTLNEVRIELTAEPEFSSTATTIIDSIPPKSSVRVENLKLNLSSNYFAQLTERIAGAITLKVNIQQSLVFNQQYPISILAYDQWSGLTILPEMLSAFITPNHPAIAPIIKRAATILEQWTGNPSLDEYQSRNPDRVRKQMGAVYTAISELNIIYSTVPASFEEQGQRIRMVETIMAQKLGTCLDMALLYASCLEAIGIHPLIVVTKGHAFAGGWLIPETFPDNVVDDMSLLTKRTAEGINDITLVETTGMNSRQDINFDQAEKLANSKLNLIDFILAIDVKRTRFSGIRPMPQRILNGLQWEIKEDEISTEDKSQIRPETINPYDLSGISQEIEVTKQLLWERKLLDLSLRNNLLNIRVTKNTLQLISANLDFFEDALANGDEFRVLHKPTDWDNPLYEFGIYQSLPDADPVIELVKSELTQSRLRSYLSENELGKALTHLYRSSRTSMEENGANTLYLALGLLKWYETKASERPRYAPILLLPVEIIRKSAAKGYVIRSREEDTMMNITLLEMLRQNFNISISGLDPLPTDDSGVNVRLIYSIVRNAIKNQPKWDVEEQAILGIFSFNKFIMWNDIHNNAHKLAKNTIVSSLMSGKIEWEVKETMVDAAELDKNSPTNIVLPISADSSQLEAIYEAVNDTSFILHGPPGTGKSQTITNLIANALYKGKRVLFVAEKMAALSVVQRRLEAIGLGPFCLELHSNKAKKSAILSQLKETSEIVRQTPPEDFQQEAEKLFKLKSELNIYIEALHKVYPFGLSLYEAITRYQSIGSDVLFDIPQSFLDHLDKEALANWQDAIETLIRVAQACGHPHQHPLEDIVIAEYSSAIKEEASKNISKATDLLNQCKSKINDLSKLFGEENHTYTKNEIDILSKIVDRLLHIPELTPQLLTLPRLGEELELYREVCLHGWKRDSIKEKLAQDYTEDILSINAQKLVTDWNQANMQWFLPRFFGQRKVKKQLKPYWLRKIENEEIANSLGLIIDYQKEKKFVDSNAHNFASLFARNGRKDQENWEVIEEIIEDTDIINKLIFSISRDSYRANRMKQALASQISEGISFFKEINGKGLKEINELMEAIKSSDQRLENSLGITQYILYGDSENWINHALNKLNNWQANIEKLKDWYQWLLVHNKLDNMHLGFIADEYKNKNIDTATMMDIFNKSFYKTAITYILDKEPSLELFNGKIFDDIIEKYKALVHQFETLTQQELVARLSANLPSFTREASQNSEVGILQRNIRNNARGTSIRRLFDQIPTLLTRMCPCMLMSPISVAQYIDADADKFDLIVFDEASQMPTYQAVGAIARGKNLVIVGDPKQMPPTNFFSVNTVDEENMELEDLESILDDCLALSMPSKHLLWHYRSKHESLIAFSNSEYYDNKLLTFPSPDNIESKVRLIPISGYYDKGKSRQNKAEAQAVVREIERRLENEELRKKSIGVVTFSIVQQNLIEDMLSELFVLRPDLETLALSSEEPLFIKNLENVQGDERDVILFSVGYGPDKEGKVSMNFGPLNRVGGERRLNVAVSRARYEMIIFSTFSSEQIDLNRTSSVGVAGLKRFLEYAERGERINNSMQITNTTSETCIHNIIADKLRGLGYTVHTNIGSSGYKIDIAIVDDENPASYKLGILCDGENYRQTKTVRDREVVQTSVLKMLGWNICRIWTLDWWENPERVIEDIRLTIAEGEKAKPIQPLVIESTVNSNTVIQEEAIKAAVLPQSKDNEHHDNNSKQAYRRVILSQVNYPVDGFYLPHNRILIKRQLQQTIEAEAPISRQLLCKRVLEAWNISRLGQKIDSYFEELLQEGNYFSTSHDGIAFYWIDEDQHQQLSNYRTESGRDALDLPPEEVAIAIREILTDEISLPTTDLSRICAQAFGFARSGSNVDAAMLRGMKEAIKEGLIRVEEGRAIIA